MKTYYFFIVLAVLPIFGYSQSILPSVDEYYFRSLQISGITNSVQSFQLRPYVVHEKSSGSHPWELVYENKEEPLFSDFRVNIQLYEPVLFQSYNTTLPRGNQDGAIWQGKGYNNAFSTGIKASVGLLHVRFRPVFGFTQNLSYELSPFLIPDIRTGNGRVPGNEFMYRDFRGSIDYVQRFGDSSYSWFDLGDSSIEMQYSGIRLALSNSHIWSGPGNHTSLQFGYSAPGFRHLYLGTTKPLQTAAGNIEFAYIFGKTKESEFFTPDREIESQSVNSLVFVYTPWFTNRFSIGAVRTYFHTYPESFSEYRTQVKKLFETGLRESLTDNGEPRGHDPDNQIASVFFRYFIPEHGFEIYAEYGRNDHNSDWRDFRGQPNHHRAYTLGLMKTASLSKNRLLSVNVEINQLEAMRTALTRGNQHLGGWYTHGNQVLGFTNDGQIMGSGYGPGVNMQSARVDLFDPGGGLSLKMARITYHNSRLDQYFDIIQAANSKKVERWEVRNVEFMIGAGLTLFLKRGVEVSMNIDQSIILNQDYIKGNDLTNTRFQLVMRKQLSGWRR